MNVFKEEKEARLKSFVARHIELLHATGVAPGLTTYRLIALSPESPAARALQQLGPELTSAGIRVEAVLFQHSPASTPKSLELAECRFVSDTRLLDAHEQLVLDASTAWVGDCLRRDPLKRDAYERFSDLCPITAGNAARSFAQIWRAAGPTGNLAANRKWPMPRQQSLFDPSLIANAEANPAPAVLRH
jgi:hypothetical protein